MRSVEWYIKRLAGMSAAEVLSRARTSALHACQRMGFFRANTVPPPEISKSPRWVRELQATNSSIYIESADAILDGRNRIFNATGTHLDGVPNWNRDPLTGVVAPAKFAPHINVYAKSEVGNIKYLWENNRHLQLVRLAQAYRLTKNNKYINGLWMNLESWFDQCPYLSGPNWSSSLEAAIRLINWAVVWQLLDADEVRDSNSESIAGFRARWLESVFQHLSFIQSHYSRHSSANNHLIGEAAGVFIASCTWPYWSRAVPWKSRAFELLVSEADKQVAVDGVNREQTIAYQRFVIEFLLICIVVGKSANVEFPAAFHDRVLAMLEFLSSVIDVSGNIPMIGDSDDGRVLDLACDPTFCPFKSVLASGAELYGSERFALAAGELDDQTRQLTGGDLWHELVQVSVGNELSRPKTSFVDGGYYILGKNLGQKDEVRMMIDSGALGYLSIAAHGHADALAIYLSIAGSEFLIDPGTFSYHADAEWRAYFRGTSAHNTLTVDGQDQSVQAGNFMWRKPASARALEFMERADSIEFEGEHSGYARLPDPVIHRRRVAYSDGVFEIVDRVLCKGDHVVRQWWHFSEKCSVQTHSGSIDATNGRSSMRLVPEVGRINQYHGSESPIAGWVSRRYGERQPTTTICVSNEIVGDTTIRTQIECRTPS